MSKLKDLTGLRFGRMLVVSRSAENNKYNRARWNCLCDCGVLKVVCSGALLNMHVQSCGCFRSEVTGKVRRLRSYESLYNKLLSGAAKRGGKGKYEVSLTYEQFLTFVDTRKCVYCHSPVMWTEFNSSLNSAAYNLDRMDDSKGYHLSNVIVCCGRCNLSKGNRFTYNEWMQAMTFLRDQRGGDHANN